MLKWKIIAGVAVLVAAGLGIYLFAIRDSGAYETPQVERDIRVRFEKGLNEENAATPTNQSDDYTVDSVDCVRTTPARARCVVNASTLSGQEDQATLDVFIDEERKRVTWNVE